MSGNARDAGRSTIDRLLTLLDVFDGPDLTLSEVADRAGLPTSTTHRMLTALEGWGGVERRESGTFRIGQRLWELGTRFSSATILRECGLPLMQDLYEATHENVQIAIRDGIHALIVERLTGLRAAPTVSDVGGRLPLHSTAVGKVLLAHAEPDVLAKVQAGGLPAFTPRTLVMPGALTNALDAVRERNLATSMEEMTLGAASVAAPVTDGSGHVVAALGVVVHSHVDLARLAPAVRVAANGISRRLAERPLPVSPTESDVGKALDPTHRRRPGKRPGKQVAARARRGTTGTT